MQFWIEKTIVKKRIDRLQGERALGKVLWSPQTSKNGSRIYNNMLKIEPGDVILHLTDNVAFTGMSIVDKQAKEVEGLAGTAWDVPSYLVNLKSYFEFEKPIDRSDVLNSRNKFRLINIAENSEVFYNNDLTLRQGAYITPCPIELLNLLNECYKLNVNSNLPYIDELGIDLIVDESLQTFQFEKLHESLFVANLKISDNLITRFTSSLLTKPFVILTGLSGSGKTKLAQAFAMWISENHDQYAIVPVGADWTNREPLLGYPNSLISGHYVKPDSGVLDILLRAHENYVLNDKNLAACKPYFLILDEMNLSHVERYFADFLSTMESGEEIKLYSGSNRYAEFDANNHPIITSKIPDKITLPKNLFIIGTVNIDETTYMFSPKVLDRANTIEFRISADDMENFYKSNGPLNMEALEAKGVDQAIDFMQLAAGESLVTNRSNHKDTFVAFFETLQSAGAEFGYRTANEMVTLVSYLKHFGMSDSHAYDIAIMQKLLPKLHGSRSKLNRVIPKLIDLCTGKYPISTEKLERMKKNAEENGFASYAEA